MIHPRSPADFATSFCSKRSCSACSWRSPALTLAHAALTPALATPSSAVWHRGAKRQPRCLVPVCGNCFVCVARALSALPAGYNDQGLVLLIPCPSKTMMQSPMVCTRSYGAARCSFCPVRLDGQGVQLAHRSVLLPARTCTNCFFQLPLLVLAIYSSSH